MNTDFAPLRQYIVFRTSLAAYSCFMIASANRAIKLHIANNLPYRLKLARFRSREEGLKAGAFTRQGH